MKKILAVLLSIILLSSFAVPTYAITFEPGKEPTYHTSGDFHYLKTYDGFVYITGYTGEISEELVIPATLDGLAVDGFWLEVSWDAGALTSLVISEGITTIPPYTFQGCTQLTGITLPSTITQIGQGAFKHCTSLQTVTYGGTEEQIAKMEIGAENDPLLAANPLFDKEEVPVSQAPSEEAPSVSMSVPEATPEQEVPVEKKGMQSTDIIVLAGLLFVFALCMVGFAFLRKK